MTLPRFLIVGFVGARRLESNESAGDLAAREALLRRRLDEVLSQLESDLRPGERLSALSALAAGGDTVFAEAASAHALPHQVFLPQTPDVFFNEKDFFDSPAVLARSRKALESPNVVEVRVASESLERRARFSEVGFRIVNECDLLVVVVRSEEAGKQGGTQETLAYARANARAVVVIALEGNLEIQGLRNFRFPESAEEIFSWPLEVDPAAKPSSLPEIAALKRYASEAARRHKQGYHRANAVVLSTHVTATVIATWSLAGFPHSISSKAAKAALLLFGTGLYLFFQRRKPHQGWVNDRLTAELARSVLALRRLPGHLGYLRTFHLPESTGLLRSLELLHLVGTRALPHVPEDFAAAYITERLGGAATPHAGAQIDHYKSKAESARRLRGWLQAGFYFLSAVAIVGAIIYIGIEVDAKSATGWEKWFCLFAPTALPVVAAAAASWISIMDLDRRMERYSAMVEFLEEQRDRLNLMRGDTVLRNAVQRIELSLLQEVAEWYARHRHPPGQ